MFMIKELFFLAVWVSDFFYDTICLYLSYKFLSRKVVEIIKCHQCDKPRCIYSLKETLSTKAARELEDTLFTCGTSFKTADIYTAKIHCNSMIESTLYTKHPTDQFICVHWSSPDFDKDGMKEKLENYTTVYPVCLLCKGKGISHFTFLFEWQ